MYILYLLLSLNTDDFVPDDDYQGITKLHILHAYSWPCYTVYLWCIHVLYALLYADTGDFVPDDDYQGIIKIHNFYAWN